MAKLEYIPKLDKFRLLEAVQLPGYLVPENILTDGATGPRFIRPFVPRISWYINAVLGHDDMLERAYISKSYADEYFKAQLARDLAALNPGWFGYSWRRVQAFFMYWFARLFGRGNY